MKENRCAEGGRAAFPWNQTQTEYPAAKCIHQLFEEQARRTPDAVAVVFEDQQLTYRELNERAEALAGQLRQLGVGPDVCVGLFMRRSLEMVVGLYAILKAGGAYLPMDPVYPAERLAFMLEDAQVPVLLTHSTVQANLPPATATILCIDAASHASRITEHTSPLAPSLSSDNLAYLIYTSGSTGKPKGVMVRHRNVVNFFTGMDQAIGAEPGVWLAVTSICFDISVLELFWTLTRGFNVVVQGEESAAHARGLNAGKTPGPHASYTLAEQLERHRVTHFQCTPSLAAMMAQDERNLRALRQIPHLLFGGEPLPPALVEQLSGRAEIFNMYGPTETTVWSMVHPVTASGGSISLGRPIANTEIYILDEQLQPVPVGVPGELFIGGAGVTRGYLNRPELTAERFILNPFSPHPEARLYRTGDLARHTAEGTIDFLGRMDQQVKIRGYRIELGEIEVVLRQHPAIRECVVSVWEPRPGDKRLAGYFVPREMAIPEPAALKSFLRAKLPDYMVPASFVKLESLPLTPNGKVDRKALPQPGSGAGEPVAREESSVIRTVPLTEGQREIWYASQMSAPASCSFNQSVALRLYGSLDLARLERSLGALVARHEALRATIAPNGEGQAIHSKMPVVVHTLDLSGLAGEAREQQLQASLAASAGQPLDLANGPLYRFELLKLAPQEQVLLLTFHHVICDGASVNILLQQLAEEYGRGGEHAARAVTAAPASFSEFVLEQEKALRTPERAAAESYWLEQYARPPEGLSLPSDRPRPLKRDFAGGSARVRFGRELTEELKRFSARQRCSLATALLGGFSLLLQRLSGQPEIVVGLPMTSRSGEAGERLVGHCVNFLPLRLRGKQQRSFIEHLGEVRQVLLEAHEHQNFTLGSLLSKLNLPRTPGRLPLASVMFNLDWGWEEVQMPGLSARVETNPYSFCRFELTLCVAESRGQLELQCQFSTELFELATIQRWLKHYETLLSAIVVEPEQPLEQLTQLLPEEASRHAQSAMGREGAAAERASTVLAAKAESSPAGEGFSSAAEERLAQIWREVIVIDQVGRGDNFFDLGGHSLLATQVISRITKSFNVELPLRTIFETPNLAALAEAIVRAQSEQVTAPAAILPQSRRVEALKLQERLSQLSDEELLALLQNPDLKEFLS